MQGALLLSLLHKLSMPRLGTSAFLLFWASVALHLFTVCVAAGLSDWTSTALSLVFPVAAQVYWVFALWELTGAFMNFLTLACFAYTAVWLVIAPIRHGLD